MRILASSYGILACLISSVAATALTYKLAPNEKACFFSYAEQKGQKLAFYFAVRRTPKPPRTSWADNLSALQVQSGGSFDVDYSVVGPNDRIIMEGSKERQGDFVFSAKEQGEYRFCFNNEMSTWVEKMVDFEIAVCSPSPYPFVPAWTCPSGNP